MIYGWDHPCTAQRYERFCSRHERYSIANRSLVEHARLERGQRVLDIAAGTGRTAELCLAAGAEVVCWEPAAAMRAVGERRLPWAQWLAKAPEGHFDRAVCGAAAWQWQPFRQFVDQAATLLAPGGAVAFNIPSLYLGLPDQPGGGPDPLLLELPARLARGAAPQAAALADPLTTDYVDDALRSAGLSPERWKFEISITLSCQADWLRIPVLTDALLGELDLEQRDARMDEAERSLDASSWKIEEWTGWIAWKR